MSESPVIVWFRQDLRLADNPALAAAIADGRPVLPLYVLDDATPGRWRPGAAGRWWLHRSLAALADDFAARGARLLLRRGRADAVLPAASRFCNGPVSVAPSPAGGMAVVTGPLPAGSGRPASPRTAPRAAIDSATPRHSPAVFSCRSRSQPSAARQSATPAARPRISRP